MARSSKPVELIQGHRSKAEIEIRAEYEGNLITGEPWKEYPEVKSNVTAHKFFKRLADLYGRIEKNDAMSEPIINRYCLIQAECSEFEEKREMFQSNLESLIRNGDIDDKDKFKLEADMQKSIIGVDKALMSKRRMLLEIEREMLLTLKAQLASIPKKPPEAKPNKFTGYLEQIH